MESLNKETCFDTVPRLLTQPWNLKHRSIIKAKENQLREKMIQTMQAAAFPTPEKSIAQISDNYFRGLRHFFI